MTIIAVNISMTIGLLELTNILDGLQEETTSSFY